MNEEIMPDSFAGFMIILNAIPLVSRSKTSARVSTTGNLATPVSKTVCGRSHAL